jgi:hypothetical protein
MCRTKTRFVKILFLIGDLRTVTSTMKLHSLLVSSFRLHRESRSWRHALQYFSNDLKSVGYFIAFVTTSSHGCRLLDSSLPFPLATVERKDTEGAVPALNPGVPLASDVLLTSGGRGILGFVGWCIYFSSRWF